MQSPVDLTNLRNMIDHDASMEKMLIEEFYVSFEKSLSELQASSDAQAWHATAHALKGVALNLGAQKLAELCKKAEADHAADPAAKQAHLQHIREEYAQVKDFLGKV